MTDPHLPPFEPEATTPLYIQVMGYLEKHIVQGRLKPGDRIPSTDELIGSLGVGRKVIQQALSRLAKRGLLERSPKRGTFVSRSLHIQEIAILFGTDLLTSPHQNYTRMLCRELIRLGAERGMNFQIHFPTNNRTLYRCAEEITRQAHEGGLRAAINVSQCQFENFPVPSVWMSVEEPESNIRDSLHYRGLSYLLSRGYRDIGLITHVNFPDQGNDLRTRKALEAIRADYSDELKIRAFAGCYEDPELDGQGYTRELFEDRTTAPEALLITDDNMTQGVIFTLLSLGLRIPEDVAILSHANAGSPLLCPVELTRLEVDPARIAANTLDYLEAVFAGHPYQHTPAPIRLVTGRSCGEGL